MSTPSTHEEVEVENSATSETKHFERNEYFHGKLMTARDMAVEQAYHRNRLHALSQHVMGSGLVCGLETEVRTVVTDDGSPQVEAYVHPGLAIDREGRPIRVPDQQWTKAKYVGDEDDRSDEPERIAVYLTYKECFTDAVPVPDVTNACEERCCYNRVIEQFDVTYTESDPTEHKMVPSITFPTQREFEAYEKNGAENHANPMLFEMARDFYDDDHALRCEAYGDFSLLLGIFERGEESKEYVKFEECTESGRSDRRDEFDESSVDRRPFVYSNDMLYAILARHATRYDNPHEVSINDVIGIGGDITLQSKVRETIDVTESKEGGWVNIEVDEHYLDELENCVGTLAALLKLNSSILLWLFQANMQATHTTAQTGDFGGVFRKLKELMEDMDDLCGGYVPDDSDGIIQADTEEMQKMQTSVEDYVREIEKVMEKQEFDESDEEDASD